MGPHHLPLCLISCGTHLHSLVSRIPLMGPHRPPLCLIWCGVHQHLMKIPLPVCLLIPLDPFASHRTWLHFGLAGTRQRPEIFGVLLEMWHVHLATSYTVLVRCVRRFARIPKLGNLVCAVQWPGVNAHGADDTMMPPGTGTPHGQLAPSCI